MADLDHRLLFAQDFALINPLQVEAALWGDLPSVPLQPKVAEDQPHLMPRLLELRALSDAARIDLLERAGRHHRRSRWPFFSALLVTEATTEKLAAHLTRKLMVAGPDQKQGLMRYHDPRVFQHLRWLLSEQQLSLLLGRVDTWTWRDGRGEWQSHSRCGCAPVLSGLRLQPEQWDTLQRFGLLNKTLRRIAHQSPDLVVEDSIARRIDVLLRDALQRHGLVDAADRCLYAEQAIRFHPGIHVHPQLAERLARAGEGIISYVGACRDFDEPTLRQFSSELVPPTRTLA